MQKTRVGVAVSPQSKCRRCNGPGRTWSCRSDSWSGRPKVGFGMPLFSDCDRTSALRKCAERFSDALSRWAHELTAGRVRRRRYGRASSTVLIDVGEDTGDPRLTPALRLTDMYHVRAP